jgi:AcrR family transcriptional regulator
MSTSQRIRVRKQQLVRDAIYDAAIELFAAKGFDETTVEEVALAAGVSRRSFFRYFESKDDLLAQNVMQYGAALSSAIQECSPTLTPLEVVRETVLSLSKSAADRPRTRQIIEISERSASARQAHASRMIEVEDSMAAAFAARLKSSSKNEMKPRLLAGVTLSVMNVSFVAWYTGESPDLSTAAKRALATLNRIFCIEEEPRPALARKKVLKSSPVRRLPQ